MAYERVKQGDPVDLSRTDHECRGRWRHPGEGQWAVMFVVAGRLGDGRWFVNVIGQAAGRARAYRTRQDAWVVAKSWMATRGGVWERVPCDPPPGAGGPASRS